MQTHYAIVDAFPDLDSDSFEEFGGAIVSYWIREDMLRGDAIEVFVSAELRRLGWVVATLLASETVNAATYADKADGRDLFEQAQEDGVAAKFNRLRRHWVGAHELPRGRLRGAFVEFTGQLATTGGVSLYSVAEEHWANGAILDEDQFVPIWLSTEAAGEWAEHWLGYSTRRLEGGAFLRRVAETEMWVGVHLADASLVMFHPAALLHALASRPN